jgi:hypothetical protein
MTKKQEFINFINSIDYSTNRVKIHAYRESDDVYVNHSFYEPKDILLNETLNDWDDNLINYNDIEVQSWVIVEKPSWVK